MELTNPNNGWTAGLLFQGFTWQLNVYSLMVQLNHKLVNLFLLFIALIFYDNRKWFCKKYDYLLTQLWLFCLFYYCKLKICYVWLLSAQTSEVASSCGKLWWPFFTFLAFWRQNGQSLNLKNNKHIIQ